MYISKWFASTNTTDLSSRYKTLQVQVKSSKTRTEVAFLNIQNKTILPWASAVLSAVHKTAVKSSNFWGLSSIMSNDKHTFYDLKLD